MIPNNGPSEVVKRETDPNENQNTPGNSAT